MTDLFVEQVNDFLARNYSYRKPLLLGYSGGSDSKALLHILKECQKRRPFPLHLAHVDHGWRKTSSEEALLLKEEAESLGFPFHLHRLLYMGPNLEAVCREERWRFFQKILGEIEGEALLLAHQKDDVGETVLKRLFEGAHLSRLYGMKEVVHREGIPIFRPLLSIVKKELSAWLSERNLSWIEDETNLKEEFLRGKMRKKILPSLSESFGKGVEENLYQLSLRSQELDKYLEKRLSPYLEKTSQGPFGRWLAFPSGLEKIEYKYLLLKYLKKSPSREELEKMLLWIERKEADMQQGDLFFDRGAVFQLSTFDFGFTEPFSLEEEGVFTWGDWQVKIRRKQGEESASWQHFLLGKVEFSLPAGKYTLRLPCLGETYGSTPLRKWWSSLQVPSFLRGRFPVVYCEDVIVKELLSGKNKKKEKPELFVSLICKSI